VQGKSAYADAVTQSVADQMDAIMRTAEAAAEAIRAALVLQEELRDALVLRQEELEDQFAEQREQLATLSGTAGVMPVDLASFIGLFPLVLGLMLAFMLWRAGQARHQGAQAAADLGSAAPDDLDTRAWLARRVLGGSDALAPSLVTITLAAGALLWIALAAWQIAHSPGDPPLAPWTSAVVAALVVLVAAGWDVAAIRRLVAQLGR
jgi:ParB-like chromosome segregation protein Spo0J